ncbi:MAG: 2-hydroxyacyl-CoA dehydratase, partial [Lachnospiraceae bacterium]|nr:2-hydroxyacyl-CoA dehydratase [Lachnospiraceae bacterium]
RFLTELKAAFVRTLKLDDEHSIDVKNSHLFAAIGSAMNASEDSHIPLDRLEEKLSGEIRLQFEVNRMDPLFASREEYAAFSKRHAAHKVEASPLSSYKGNCYLGIDAGSTTTKLALISEDGRLLYSFYSNNNGSPINTAIRAIKEIHRQMPEGARIVSGCSTGYGEALLKSAFMLEEGEVETIAHYYAAAFFDPEVDCIVDIGGQDMKCIRIRNKAVDNVMLNEACSSGCGSFIETFAKSLDYSVENFAKAALFAEHPIDLGTRCTVFMNSRVKQAQKEGAKVEDISAGLAYSVIKNALFKVMKVSSAKELGSHIVVQGGTFYNDAVLRSFEKVADCEVIRPDIAGIMGAFGAALIARERYDESVPGTMLSFEEIENLKYETSLENCGRCTNNCRLTVNRFDGTRSFISGNRCERGLGKEISHSDIPNMYRYKLKRLFSDTPLSESEAKRGTFGISRVLNIYENYPFWYTFFTRLGYRVVLSPLSTHGIYELGIESIPSESECYPAKLSHGHISWLINKGIDFIFYPALFYERDEFGSSDNHYNCPIVTSYPENIKNNVEELADRNIRFSNPFMAFTSLETVTAALKKEFADIPADEVAMAAAAAWEELANTRRDIQKEGERVLQYMEEHKINGIVLAGRPYHIDPEINHGIPEMITGYGVAVLSEDGISHLASPERPITVLDQWMYHTRMYAAAAYVRTRNDLNLIQLNSFGCGIDAVTTDQVNDILSGSDRIYTCLKIDEVNNLGSARIRVRSLLAAIRIKERLEGSSKVASTSIRKVPFTEDMRKNYTILCPQMSPIHFELMEPAMKACGYNMVVLPNDNRKAVDFGLKYVNNDACYPSLFVVGQIMEALESGKYDPDRTAVIMSQTGGGCRASNYVGFIRRALRKAGMEQIPVISANLAGIEDNPGFKVDLKTLSRLAFAIVIGDVFMRCVYRMRPYELEPGSVNALHAKWREKCIDFLSHLKTFNIIKLHRICKQIIKDFDAIPIDETRKPRVGIVGEILVKYAPAANNYLVDLLEAEGAEASVPDLMGFMLYCFYNQVYKADHFGTSRRAAFLCNNGIRAIEFFLRPIYRAYEKSRHFEAPASIYSIVEYAKPIVSIGNQTGEGWFLTGEMVELIHAGIQNIVCIQPFGCLPNHVVGKGVVKQIHKLYPMANIAAVDYDPGASEVNQLNRIKLMLAAAERNMEKERAAAEAAAGDGNKSIEIRRKETELKKAV